MTVIAGIWLVLLRFPQTGGEPLRNHMHSGTCTCLNKWVRFVVATAVQRSAANWENHRKVGIICKISVIVIATVLFYIIIHHKVIVLVWVHSFDAMLLIYSVLQYSAMEYFKTMLLVFPVNELNQDFYQS